jgi:type II secretory pathway component PulJ
LIEVLLATAIFSVVIIAINTVFFAALHLRRAADRAVEESRPLQHALSLLRKDLQNAVNPGGVLAGHFRSEGPSSGLTDLSSASANSTRGTGAATPATADSSVQGGLDFFTTTGVISDYQVGGDIQEVNYQLRKPEDDEAFGLDLMRSVTRTLLAYSSPVVEEQKLLRNVEEIEYEFFDGLNWRETWDTTLEDTPALPRAVRVRLHLAIDPARRSSRLEPVELVVLLNSRATAATSTNETETAEGTVQ